MTKEQIQHMGPKDLAAMLAVMRLVGDAPGVNLRNPQCTGRKARKQGTHPGLKPRLDITITRGISGPQKRHMSLKNLQIHRGF